MECTNLSDKILDYITNRASPKLEALEKNAEKERSKTEDPEELAELELRFSVQRQELEAKYSPANWLSDASRRAKQIQFVTHPIKFSNPLIKGGSSCYFPSGQNHAKSMADGEILCTASLGKPIIDVVGNAAALDVAALLQLEDVEKSLVEYIRQEDPEPLQCFATDEGQLQGWMDGFKHVFSEDKPSSHNLAKQLYFPVGEGVYHLLSPLYPSSLVQEVYMRITESRFSEDAKQVRKARRESKYSEAMQIDYPGTAIQTFGGTKPQNVSQLNSRRYGKSFLLPSGPPDWQTQNKPPLAVKTVFSRYHFGLRAGKDAWLLRKYLEQNAEKENNVTIREQRLALLDRIIDHLFQYGAEIQSLRNHAGWTSLSDCKLAFAEQLWLDPYRDDDSFLEERQKNNWQSDIAANFAFWLNDQINKGKKFTLGDVEHREWKSSVEEKLRLLKEDLEVFG